MAVIALTGAVVTLNGTGGPPPTGGAALPHVRSVTIDYSNELQDVTEMGMTTRANLVALFDWTISVECIQDYGAANVDATLFPLVGAAEFYIQVKSQAGAVSATNPQFYGKALLENYGPIAGTVGDAMVISAVFRPGTTVATNVLTRSTS